MKHSPSVWQFCHDEDGVFKVNTTQGRVLNVTNGNEGGYTRPAIQGPVRQVPPPKDEKREYMPVEIESFPAEIQDAYNQYRELRTMAAKAREEFEAAMTPVLSGLIEVPQGREINYWYNYGLLNVSVETIKAKKAKAKSNAISFK